MNQSLAEHAEAIAALTGQLGTAEGLERTRHVMDLLCARLEAPNPAFTRAELEHMKASIAALSSSVFEMFRIVHERIRELGGEKIHVG